jgi:hypothetical protein
MFSSSNARLITDTELLDTGDRPYMCVLCRDTFSRSDILKRHFQKCSIRRGNPTGVSHLSHPQAHVKKNAQAQKAAGMGHEGDLNQLNGLTNLPQDGMTHPFGMVPVQDGMNNMGNDQNQLSRSSSIGRVDNSNGSDRRSMPGQVMGASQPYGGNDVPGQQMPTYSMPPGQNGMPMYGGSNSNQQSGLDWSQMFQPGAHHTYVNNAFPPNIGQTPTAIKTEHEFVEPRPTGASTGDSSLYSNWGLPSNVQNPYNQLSDQILNFFYPPSQVVDPHLAGMNLYFSPDNVKDFLDNYTHFHIHTPVIHVPTFKVMEAYTGLLAAMCCIGACYSDRVEASNVREMMDFLWVALERDCKLLSPLGPQAFSGPFSSTDTEHFQAILITAILNLWNGTPAQRERARQTFPILISQARQLNLQYVSRDETLFSPLHQPDFNASDFTIDSFDWGAWIEQEKRVRVMLGIYLGDVAMGLFFNRQAEMDTFELCIPLPCEDQAWDASSREDCLIALGLQDSAMNEAKPSGTRRATQPEVKWAVSALLHSSIQIQPGSTNLYGKFVLIHAIMALIRRAQTEGPSMVLSSLDTPPPSDWAVPTKASDGRATPVTGAGQAINHNTLITLSTALDKFKYNWDVDMMTQFPPSNGQVTNPKRSGFSRDGIHFYWLAKYVLKYTSQADLQLSPDERLMQVMQLLKSVRTWVMTDGASRGEELGSIGEIDENYGTTDLTLDMAKLFTPLPRVVEDAGTASVKTELDTAGS